VMCRSNTNVVPILSDILSESVKEKVTRIILATFRVSDLSAAASAVQHMPISGSLYLLLRPKSETFIWSETKNRSN